MTAVRKSATVSCPFCSTLNRVDLGRAGSGPKCGKCGKPLRLDRPLAVTDRDFERVVEGSDVPVLVDFHADWCGPCKIMAPTIDQVAHDRMGEVLVVKLDTDRNPQTSMRFNIRGIPCLIVFSDGREAGREVGAVPRQRIDALLDAALAGR
ncbi:MAG TPA: thioredoxin [Longimicrobiaceae bacterium]|nr:thioredoxin [Longimicrobiaceae bacterium]